MKESLDIRVNIIVRVDEDREIYNKSISSRFSKTQIEQLENLHGLDKVDFVDMSLSSMITEIHKEIEKEKLNE